MDYSSHKRNWRQYLKVLSNTYRLPFALQNAIYNVYPTATAVATLSQWNHLGHRVSPDATGVKVVTSDGRKMVWYDVSDTSSANVLVKWKLEHDVSNVLFPELQRQTGVSYHPDWSFEENLNAVVEKLIRTDIQTKYREFIRDSILYTTFQRLNISEDKYTFDFEYVTTLTDKAIHDAAVYISSVSSQLITLSKEADDIITKSLAPQNTPEEHQIHQPISITCNWSESPVFETGKTYTVAEFDKKMAEADKERCDGWNSGQKKYGSDESWEAQDSDSYYKYLGYDKTSFTVNLPNGNSIEERQDIGDGYGGVISFFATISSLKQYVPLLEAQRDLDIAIQKRSARKEVYNKPPEITPPQSDLHTTEKAEIFSLASDEQLICKELRRRGSGFQYGKFLLQSIVRQIDVGLKDKAMQISNAYGIGGSSNSEVSENHNAKGLEIVYHDKTSNSDRRFSLKWTDVCRYIASMVNENSYISYDEAIKFVEYIRNDAHTKPVNHEAYLVEALRVIRLHEVESYLKEKKNLTDIVSNDCGEVLRQLRIAIIALSEGRVKKGYFEWINTNEVLSKVYSIQSDKEITSAIENKIIPIVNAAMHEDEISNDELESAIISIESIVESPNLVTDIPLQRELTDDIPKLPAISQKPRVYDITNRNYEKLCVMFPDFMSKKHSSEMYEVSDSSCFMPLSLEWISQDQISIMHTYMQNGDVMRDPDVVLTINQKNMTAIAYSFENSGLSKYEVYDDAIKHRKEINDVNSFVAQWLVNITEQHYKRSMYRINDKIVYDIPHEESQSDYINKREIHDVYSEGDIVTVSDRTYTIDTINTEAGTVSLRDDNAGLTPRWHTERIDAVELAVKQQGTVQELANDLLPNPITDYRITDHKLGEGGPKHRYQDNVEAIKLLKELEHQHRNATPEEQHTLSKYVGWGGISKAFDSKDDNWHNEYEELKTILSDEEYASAKDSTLSAFYTQPMIIEKMYNALERFGFEGGNILEPSMGVGNFFGMMPEKIRKNSRLHGVEIDSISGRIAKQLYQSADIKICGFEDTSYADNYFDVAISNVPFGDYSVSDRRYNKHNFLIHDYFFAKTLDKVRPGGVVAFITSSGTMDKLNSSLRQYISERATLIGAIRLPNNAFKSNAGTEVVSDIIFLQKRDSITANLDKWVNTSRLSIEVERPVTSYENDKRRIKTTATYNINSYFVEHPEMVCGKLVDKSTRYGYDITCVPFDDKSLEESLDECINNLTAAVSYKQFPDEMVDRSTDCDFIPDDAIPATQSVENFGYTIVNGKIYRRQGSMLYPQRFSSEKSAKITFGLVELLITAKDIISSQEYGIDDVSLQDKQSHLSEIYDNFIKEHGCINTLQQSKLEFDSSLFSFLRGLETEHVSDNGSKHYIKAKIFSQRTIKQRFAVTHCDTAADAFIVCMQNKAALDIPYMMKLTGYTEEQIIEALNGTRMFKDPARQKWVTSDEYLSGNVRDKLRIAKSFAATQDSYKVNVEALSKVQPKWLHAEEISVQLGSSWVPTSVIEDFISDTFKLPYSKVEHFDETATWWIDNKSNGRYYLTTNEKYGTGDKNALEILENTLNLQDVKVYDRIDTPDGKQKSVVNRAKTAEALEKQYLIKQAFDEWIWKDEKRTKELERIYNEEINNEVARVYDGSYLNFEGMASDIELKPYQKNAVARAIYSGNCLFAHVVGAGKTFEMIATAMEQKRVGIANKPLFVVPNHLIGQWGADFLRLYPNANVLMATSADFEKSNRKTFISRIATGDYDAVIVGESTFAKMKVSQERRARYYKAQIDAYEKYENSRRYGKKDLSVKQTALLRKKYQKALEKLEYEVAQDDEIMFEELGVDSLFVDEAHGYKNLSTPTRLTRVAGISSAASKKSEDLLLKIKYLSELNGGDRGVVFATGTPISNSLTEMYTMQRYLQPNFLKEHKLQHFDNWIANFGTIETVIELDPTGTKFRAKSRCSSFRNLPELMTHFRRCADIQTASMIKLPLPKLKNGQYTVCVTEPSTEQADYIAHCGERADAIHNGNVDPKFDNMLKVTNDGKMCALDYRLINPMAEDRPDSKINIAVNNVYRKYLEYDQEKYTQIIFLDKSTPSGSDFNLYDDIKGKLVAKGIPADEIAYIHDANTDSKKLELFAKVNEGSIRIIMGSTPKMGTGTNIQQKLCALHHIDVPWRPSDIEQREGRILRQGNICPEVEIFRYATKGTFDSYSWQTIENKQKFISQVMTDEVSGRSADEVDEQALTYAEIKMLATGDTRIKEQLELSTEVARLKLQRGQYQRLQAEAKTQLNIELPAIIQSSTEFADKYARDIEYLKQFPKQSADSFSIEIQGVKFTEKADAGAALLALKNSVKPDEVIGRYRGFDISLAYGLNEMEYEVVLRHEVRLHTGCGESNTGIIIRMDNLLDSRLEYMRQVHIEKIDNAITQKAECEKVLSQPFEFESEYREKSAKLDKLNRELRINEVSNEAVMLDDTPLDLTTSNTELTCRR